MYQRKFEYILTWLEKYRNVKLEKQEQSTDLWFNQINIDNFIFIKGKYSIEKYRYNAILPNKDTDLYCIDFPNDLNYSYEDSIKDDEALDKSMVDINVYVFVLNEIGGKSIRDSIRNRYENYCDKTNTKLHHVILIDKVLGNSNTTIYSDIFTSIKLFKYEIINSSCFVNLYPKYPLSPKVSLLTPGEWKYHCTFNIKNKNNHTVIPANVSEVIWNIVPAIGDVIKIVEGNGEVGDEITYKVIKYPDYTARDKIAKIK